MKCFFRTITYAVTCLALMGAVLSPLAAQTVNREELEENQAAVNFINYEGAHDAIDTVEQIRAIGYDLGTAVRDGAAQAGGNTRYFVFHCVADPDEDKYDADVFGLGIDVGVDHIRNLRLIIQGYLEGAYGYSTADAALLSRFVTVYNAVFRGDWDFFNNRYKTVVLENLVQERAGLSIRYDEWPGQTLMTIPLGTGIPGSLGAIDTSGLTDPNVIDSMRGEEGRGVEDRQGMVELKEKEAEEAGQSAAQQREAIREQEITIARDNAENAAAQQRIQQQQQQAQQRQQQARQDEAAGRISPEESQRQQREAQQRQDELAQQERQAEEQRRDIEERQRAVEEQRLQAEADQQRADQKTQEAQQERQQIAQDQQEMIESGSTAGAAPGSTPGSTPPAGGTAVASAGSAANDGTASPPAATPAAAAPPAAGGGAAGILGATIQQSKLVLGQIVKLDPADGSTLQSSPINTINARTITFSGSRIFAIAGKKGGIRLVEINPGTLEVLNQGADNLSPNSLLWTSGNDIYAIALVSGKAYLARFGQDLSLQARTEMVVHPFASCLVQGGKVLTQDTKGNPLILDAQTLKK
ncbi:MAG: hypothetical protein LBG84_10160 [Treponema sp.]|jgi:hypothetical protein|nr:hypothetical protein [Treponema sp.]